MENVRKRINVKLCNNERQFKRHVVKPEFCGFKMFNEDLVGVHLPVAEQAYLRWNEHFRLEQDAGV